MHTSHSLGTASFSGYTGCRDCPSTATSRKAAKWWCWSSSSLHIPSALFTWTLHAQQLLCPSSLTQCLTLKGNLPPDVLGSHKAYQSQRRTGEREENERRWLSLCDKVLQIQLGFEFRHVPNLYEKKKLRRAFEEITLKEISTLVINLCQQADWLTANIPQTWG